MTFVTLAHKPIAMPGTLIRNLKKRRDNVNRQLDEMRAKTAELEVRADELERMWKDAVTEEAPSIESGPTYICEPKVAIAPSTKIADLILEALHELDECGYDGADRTSVVAIVRRAVPKMKPNTIRVAFSRLLKKGRIERIGNLYRLPLEGETAATKKTAAAS